MAGGRRGHRRGGRLDHLGITIDAVDEIVRGRVPSTDERDRLRVASADPARRVLLLEAGGRDSWIWFHIPVGYLFAIGNPRADWMYTTAAVPGLVVERPYRADGRVAETADIGVPSDRIELHYAMPVR